MKFQVKSVVNRTVVGLFLGLLFHFPVPASGQIDANHFCNLISAQRYDQLRFESFKSYFHTGCSVYLVEGGRPYSAKVDLERDTFDKAPTPILMSLEGDDVEASAPIKRGIHDPITWRYTVDLTEDVSLTVEQTENGSHLLVGVTYSRPDQQKIKKSASFTGDRRSRVAHSVVLDEKSSMGVLFFEDNQNDQDSGESSLIAAQSICAFLTCQDSGDSLEHHSAKEYVEQIVSGNLLASYLSGKSDRQSQTMAYYVLLLKGDDQLTVTNVKDRRRLQPALSADLLSRQLFKVQGRKRGSGRPTQPFHLPMGFLCTSFRGLRMYLFDFRQALVRVFGFPVLGSSDVSLKTVDFWQFFRCNEPKESPPTPDPDDEEENTEKPYSTGGSATPERSEFTFLLTLVVLIGGTVLLSGLLFYCCLCRRRRAKRAASRLILEHSTTLSRSSGGRRAYHPKKRRKEWSWSGGGGVPSRVVVKGRLRQKEPPSVITSGASVGINFSSKSRS